jgi:hypothetical protein
VGDNGWAGKVSEAKKKKNQVGGKEKINFLNKKK